MVKFGRAKQQNWGRRSNSSSISCGERFAWGKKKKQAGQTGPDRGLVPALGCVVLEATQRDGQKILHQPINQTANPTVKHGI